MIEQLINKYFDKKSSSEEKKTIYEQLINRQSEYSAYFSEEEWDAFISSDEAAREQEAKLIEFEREATKNRRIVFYKRMSYAAASVIILFSIFLMTKEGFLNRTPQIAEQKSPESSDLVVRFNSSAATEKIILSDSSVVELSEGSKLTYLSNFEADRRQIQLDGTATFNVFKNSQRPFTVFSKEVATTALGTKFKISDTRPGKVVVELMEGKLLVRRSVKEEKNKDEEFYLLAGNAISFDRSRNKFTDIYSMIAAGQDKTPSAPANKPETEKLTKNAEPLSTRRIETETSIQFSDERLSNVLDYLASAHNVKIIYPTKYISRIRFVGKVHKNEEIQKILENLAVMNDLELKEDTAKNVYVIHIPSK